MPNPSAHHIKSIYLSKLFGRYTYAIPREGEILSDLNILYGENGLGKTTLLSLVFHLLSPAQNRSHKSAIAKVPFHLLSVTLHDGTIVTAEKDPQLLIGPVAFGIQNESTKTEWRFIPNFKATISAENLPRSIDVNSLPQELREEVKQVISQREYFEHLSKLEVVSYMLTSDRILFADSIERADLDAKRRASEAPRRISEIVSDQRNGAVTRALENASSWLQTKLIERGYGASESASNVYQQVVARIVRTPYKTSEGLNKIQQNKLRDSLLLKIDDLNNRAAQFAKLGLLARTMISPALVESVKGSSGNKLNLIDNVLSPHLEELKARLDSIAPFYKLVNGFVSNVNKFFSDKYVIYTLRHGVQIFSNQEGSKAQILPDQLSSGEQQLLLIFCNVLITRDTPNIFIIDEPEISLNILWQRMLVSSLQELSTESHVQFLFASHSMEILAKHRSRVVTLEAK